MDVLSVESSFSRKSNLIRHQKTHTERNHMNVKNVGSSSQVKPHCPSKLKVIETVRIH